MHFSQFKFDQHLFLYTVVPGILYCNLAAINRRHLGGGKKKMFITVKKKPPTIDTNTRNTFKNNIINGHVDMYEVV